MNTQNTTTKQVKTLNLLEVIKLTLFFGIPLAIALYTFINMGTFNAF